MAQRLSEYLRKEEMITWVSSKNFMLDVFMGKGLPARRIAEIYGLESCGKTTLGLAMANAFPEFLYVDAEQAMEPTRISQIIDTSKCEFVQTQIVEEIFEEITKYLKNSKSEVKAVFLDSLAVTSTEDEYRADRVGEQGYGGAKRAANISEGFRKLVDLANNKNAFIIVANQVYDEIGDSWGNNEYTPGGRAKNYYFSIRIKLRRREVDTITEGGKRVAIISRATMMKNKLAPRERREIHIPIFFDNRVINCEMMMLENLIRAKVCKKNEKKRGLSDEEKEAAKGGYSLKFNGKEYHFTIKEFIEKYSKDKEIRKYLRELIK